MQIILPESKIKNKSISPWGIFSRSLKVVFSHFGSFAGTYCLMALPVLLLGVATSPAFFRPVGLPAKCLYAALILLGYALQLWLFAAMLVVARKAIDKSGVLSIVENVAQSAKRLLPFILATLLIFILIFGIVLFGAGITTLVMSVLLKQNVMLAIVFGLIAAVPFVFALVYFVIRFSLGGAVSVVEEKGPLASLKRSRVLINEHVAPVVGAYFLIALFTISIAVLSAVLIIPAAPFIKTASLRVQVLLAELLQYGINMLFAPICACALNLLIDNLKEAVDNDVHA